MSGDPSDDLSALALEELDAACALDWREMARITPWGDTYEALTPGGLEVEVERRYLWSESPGGPLCVEIEVRLPGTRQGSEVRAVITPPR